MNITKVFGIGFHKSGSTTLESALRILGYSVIGKQDKLFEAFEKNDFQSIDKVVGLYDGFRDMPWPLYYDTLDKKYPGSKFILTHRNCLSWINSCRNHYKSKGHEEFEKIYGVGNQYPVGKEDIWITRYLDHARAVRKYFNNRSSDFIELNWEKGDGWKEICAFLQKDQPVRNFPHANKGKYSNMSKAWRRVQFIVNKKGWKKKNLDI